MWSIFGRYLVNFCRGRYPIQPHWPLCICLDNLDDIIQPCLLHLTALQFIITFLFPLSTFSFTSSSMFSFFELFFSSLPLSSLYLSHLHLSVCRALWQPCPRWMKERSPPAPARGEYFSLSRYRGTRIIFFFSCSYIQIRCFVQKYWSGTVTCNTDMKM